MEIQIKNTVKETYTNKSGHELYLKLKPFFINDKEVFLSFENSTPVSSSFLNSSFGVLIDEYGLAKFKRIIKPSNITKTQARVLKDYVRSFEKSVVGEH